VAPKAPYDIESRRIRKKMASLQQVACTRQKDSRERFSRIKRQKREQGEKRLKRVCDSSGTGLGCFTLSTVGGGGSAGDCQEREKNVHGGSGGTGPTARPQGGG